MAEIVLLFYVENFLVFSASTDTTDVVYAYAQAYFKIEDDWDMNKNLGMELDRLPYGSIHIIQPYITQSITNMLPGMDM